MPKPRLQARCAFHRQEVARANLACITVQAIRMVKPRRAYPLDRRKLLMPSKRKPLPSGWITRWSNPGVYKPIIPFDRRQDFGCAGKIDCSPILTIRDAKIITEAATYGATEMVIAVGPYGVLREISYCIFPLRSILYVTGPLHHLAYFCHRRETGKAPLIKLDPGRTIRLTKEDCLGRITYSDFLIPPARPFRCRSFAASYQG
jgi:hypothetical protein